MIKTNHYLSLKSINKRSPNKHIVQSSQKFPPTTDENRYLNTQPDIKQKVNLWSTDPQWDVSIKFFLLRVQEIYIEEEAERM